MHNTTGGISKIIQARETLDLNETNGLEILDLKRRRLEESNLSGLTNIQTNDDTDMAETQNNGIMESKNLEKAGAAMQARLSS